jgi:hypothetical protein
VPGRPAPGRGSRPRRSAPPCGPGGWWCRPPGRGSRGTQRRAPGRSRPGCGTRGGATAGAGLGGSGTRPAWGRSRSATARRGRGGDPSPAGDVGPHPGVLQGRDKFEGGIVLVPGRQARAQPPPEAGLPEQVRRRLVVPYLRRGDQGGQDDAGLAPVHDVVGLVAQAHRARGLHRGGVRVGRARLQVGPPLGAPAGAADGGLPVRAPARGEPVVAAGVRRGEPSGGRHRQRRRGSIPAWRRRGVRRREQPVEVDLDVEARAERVPRRRRRGAGRAVRRRGRGPGRRDPGEGPRPAGRPGGGAPAGRPARHGAAARRVARRRRRRPRPGGRLLPHVPHGPGGGCGAGGTDARLPVRAGSASGGPAAGAEGPPATAAGGDA